MKCSGRDPEVLDRNNKIAIHESVGDGLAAAAEIQSLDILEMSAFVSLKLAEIPDYLHAGSFFQALSSGDDGTDSEIEVPLRCYKPDCFVDDTTDLEQMFRIVQFWGLDRIPTPVLHFLYNNDFSLWKDVAANVLGESALLSAFQKVFDRPATSSHIVNAIESGLTEFVEYCIEFADPSEKTSGAAVLAACKRGRADFLKLLHQHGFSWSEASTEAAALRGHLDCLVYLHTNGCPWDTSVYSSAALAGHLDCIKYAHESGLEPTDEEMCNNAASRGYLGCLQYGFEHDFPFDQEVTLYATQGNNIECLAYALENECPLMVPQAMDAALSSGYLECIRLIDEYGGLLDARAAAVTAYSGHVDCLTYIHETGCPWTSQTTDWAAQKGHVDCLRYAIEHGCPYSSSVVKLAAQAGSLACLTYLIDEKGMYMCEDGSVMEAALTGAHYECLKFLFEKNCPMGRCYFGDEVCWTYYDRYRTQVDWDENLLKCILLAISHGWNYTYKNNLKDYILDYKNELPKCLEHITINKW